MDGLYRLCSRRDQKGSREVKDIRIEPIFALLHLVRVFVRFSMAFSFFQLSRNCDRNPCIEAEASPNFLFFSRGVVSSGLVVVAEPPDRTACSHTPNPSILLLHPLPHSKFSSFPFFFATQRSLAKWGRAPTFVSGFG